VTSPAACGRINIFQNEGHWAERGEKRGGLGLSGCQGLSAGQEKNKASRKELGGKVKIASLRAVLLRSKKDNNKVRGINMDLNHGKKKWNESDRSRVLISLSLGGN